MNHIELGQYGEDLAVNYLVNKGYQILDKNYRWGRGELDVICLNEKEVVIVEVKTRNSYALGKPFESITKSKQQQIIKITNQYVVEKRIDKEIRFDVVSIVTNRKELHIEHIENAFYPLV